MAAVYFSCILMILWPLHTVCWNGNGYSHNTHCDYCHNGGSCEYSGQRDIRCHCQSSYTGDRCEASVTLTTITASSTTAATTPSTTTGSTLWTASNPGLCQLRSYS
ncbi:sushi, nidogen and EGF-like domain-containing protein 1 [Dreissena polymorpha]|uniref:sushi, nidogen and EGF-like domain-containing protein 1 n=1 Tax=Dreissena polymorpha TaxID=45954 RepID=UPI002264CB4A|nr:sushi, nidogen and EGF-like domain-containing protein 1 [Dreissena polymorpha]